MSRYQNNVRKVGRHHVEHLLQDYDVEHKDKIRSRVKGEEKNME